MQHSQYTWWCARTRTFGLSSGSPWLVGTIAGSLRTTVAQSAVPSRADSRRILVTGARGFVGSHIVARARAGGLDVVAAYRGASGREAVPLDVCDAGSVDAAFLVVSPSVVIHCAAYGVSYADQDWNRGLEVNVLGALCVLEVAARHHVRRFVHIGSCFEYGSRSGPIGEDAPLSPMAMYGATKAAATLLLRERARALGIPLVIGRPFGIWGPGEAAHRLIPQVIAACLNSSPLNLTTCEVMRDYMYVEDVADCILALTSNEVAPGTIVNIGTGQGVVLRDFVCATAKLLGGDRLMRFGALPCRSTEMPSLVADVKRMNELLGTRPRTALAEGVRRMVACSDLSEMRS